MSMDGARHIMIRREDRQRVYMVMPDMGMVMEMVFDGSNGMPSAGDYANLQPAELGRETIRREAVTMYRIEAGKGGESYTVMIWATDAGIALCRDSAPAEGGSGMQHSYRRRGTEWRACVSGKH